MQAYNALPEWRIRMNVKVIADNTTTILETDGTQSILSLLQQNNIYADAPCNGNGTCGKCKVLVKGCVSPLTQVEQKLLSAQEVSANVRLACRIFPVGDAEIQLDLADKFGVQSEGIADKYDILTRVNSNALQHSIGLAVDIGTTTIACYFYDLKSGTRIHTCSGLNEQRAFGADVISRINTSIEREDGLKLLQSTVVAELNSFIADFCAEYHFSKENICDVIVAGNTVMLHLFGGYNPNKIAVAPFTPTSLFGFDLNAYELGLDVATTTKVFLTDCISGYVGGDITVGVLSSGAYMSEKPCIFIDIGTNGEMAIGDKTAFTCCATAAGPAFEGAHIKYGVGGIAGAIDAVSITDEGEISFTTIGGVSPVGICGSGIISAIAALVKLGVIDETGRLDEEYIPEKLLYRYNDDDTCFVLDVASGIAITQKDVREVQLAKAAIAAGINTMLHEKQLTFTDIDKVYLAGGFGSFIDKRAACDIGLLPKALFNKIHTVGNAAGMGAIRLLLNGESIEELHELTRRFTYYELSGDAFFQDDYIEQMCFE